MIIFMALAGIGAVHYLRETERGQKAKSGLLKMIEGEVKYLALFYASCPSWNPLLSNLI